MKYSSHPAALLHTDWINLIQDTASSSEDQGKLHPYLLELIYQQGWFKLMVPSIYGGQERTLPEVVRLEEALSWADGSLGWVVTLCSGAGWFGGFLAPSLADEIFSRKDVCLAGSGAVSGTATKTETGFVINGSWKYASGAMHATIFTVSCTLMNDSTPIRDASGNEIVKSFILYKDEVRILPAWKSVGLKATGSHFYEVKDLEVAEERCFEIGVKRLITEEPLYKYPFLQLAEATLAVNTSGMALRFLELAGEIISKRIGDEKLSKPRKIVLQQALTNSKEKFTAARLRFYESLDRSWNKFSAGKPDENELVKVSETSRQLAQTGRACVDDLYPYCGLIAANPDTIINRVWRDIHTASQHSLLTFSQ